MKIHLLCIFFALIVINGCTEPTKNHVVIIDETEYDKAYDFYEKQQFDSAFVNFNKAKDKFLKSRAFSKAGNCYVNMGNIQVQTNDYYGAQETAVLGLKFLDESDERDNIDVTAAYNVLALAAHSLKNYNQALDYYTKAINFTSDEKSKLICEYNIGTVYKDQGRYKEAISKFEKLSTLAAKRKDEYQIAMLLNMLAYTKWLNDKNYNAEPHLLKAMEMRKAKNDRWGLCSSYMHLMYFYENKDVEKSVFYAKELKNVARAINNLDDEIIALQKIVLLTPDTESRKIFTQLEKTRDSITLARSGAKNQYALVRYESLKNRNDYLKIEAANEKNLNRILKQNFTIVFLAGFLLCILVYMYRSRRFMQKSKEFAVKNTELQYSKKIHDIVANGLYNLIAEIENNETLSKETILNKLSNMYDSSRDISHDLSEEESVDKYLEKILLLARSFSSQDTQIFVIGNSRKTWELLNAQKRWEIYLVLRELLVNMKKHSRASRVSIKIENFEDQLRLTYRDNGKGLLDFYQVEQSGGFCNIKQRVKDIDGSLTMTENENGGLVVQIQVKA